MRDTTNTATGPATSSAQNLVSLILGKKNSTQDHPATAAVTKVELSEMPSPPKPPFEQENEWETTTAGVPRSPDVDMTIRMSNGAHALEEPDQDKFQLPSPMKYGAGDTTMTNSMDNDDDAHYQAAPTTTFVLARAPLPDDDYLNESVAGMQPPVPFGSSRLVRILDIHSLVGL